MTAPHGVARVDARGRSIAGDPDTAPTADFPTTPTRHRATSRRRSSTPATATPKTTTGWRRRASTCAERSRSSGTRSLQLSRLQGAHGAAARRRRHPDLFRSRRRRLREGQGVSGRPWGPESRMQRGGIAYDFIVPGDPLTPGWASMPGARVARATRRRCRGSSARRSRSRTRASSSKHGRTRVPSVARRAADHLSRWTGDTIVRAARERSDDRIRPIWTVTGMIRGSEQPDDVVIVGNHRDAWMYGGVDPSSGSAALVELARARSASSRDRLATAAIDPLRELGRRGVRADVVDRVGRTARGWLRSTRSRI